MRKNLRLKHVCSPTHHHPSFIWSLFNILKHNHWRFIKKRLPHKRLARRHAAAKNTDNNIKPSNNEDQVQSISKTNNVEKKSKRQISEEKLKKNPETKSSVKARIKALITDEKKCKRRSKHQRSLTEIESLQDSETSDHQNDETSRTYNNPDDITSPAFGSLNPLYLMSEESSSSDSEEHNIETQCDNEDVKKSNKKVKFVEEDGEDEEPLVLSDGKRAFFDALNLINMNKDFLLKVLQDPGSPLARHFQSQQTLSAKTGLKKQGSFPEFGARKGVSESNMIKTPKEEMGLEEKFDLEENDDEHDEEMTSIVADNRTEGNNQKLNEPKIKGFSENNSSVIGIQMRKRGRNQMVIKRFKDLRQKLRQEINKESKNEKHRIAMDAVLHKVPCKNGFSKDLDQETLDQIREKLVEKSRRSSFKLKHSRTTSLNGSLDRYLQLYDCSFSKEGKNQENEKSNLGFASKSLGRILSMPEMKSYSYKGEEFQGTLMSVKEFDEVAGSGSLDEEKIESEEQLLQDVLEEVQEHEQRMDFADEDEERDYDKNISGCYENDSDSEMESFEEDEEESLSLPEPVSLVKISQEDSDPNTTSPNYSDQVVFMEDISNRHQDTIAISNKQEQHNELLHDVHIEAEDRAKFDYIRDILELSGFSSQQSITTWHSDYPFLDPLVYEEVTGCLFCDPECSAYYYDGGNCSHLLLFDLINEVLMDIYEHYYHYCSTSLSGLCQIHPMPVGFSMLKQVWVRISWYLRLGSGNEEKEKSVECIVSRDLWKVEGWMNLQFDSECVGIEVEDLIFDQLLEELILD